MKRAHHVRRLPVATDLSLRMKCDDLAERLEEIARKAGLLSLAASGLMALHDNLEAWPMPGVENKKQEESNGRAANNKNAENSGD
jgi:hypothetical protein